MPRLHNTWGSSHRWTGIFSVFRSFNSVKVVTPCSTSFGFLAGPWWDSETERKKSNIHTLINGKVQ